MANMSDRTNVVAPTMNFWLNGGSAPTAPTAPLKLRLMTAQGSNTANGTEAGGSNGYTTGGNTMGSPAFGASSAGVSASSNAVSWTATGALPAAGPAVAIEIWDSTGTPKRLLQGAITSVQLANGNTLTFAAGSITADASAW